MVFIAALFVLATRPALAADIGFEEVRIAKDMQPPLIAGIWYPPDAQATPRALGHHAQTVALDAPIAGDHLLLIVMSHGGGGWYDGHYDTALALAHAGVLELLHCHHDACACNPA
jgi:predicted dienelactone hydrolase